MKSEQSTTGSPLDWPLERVKLLDESPIYDALKEETKAPKK